MRAPRKSRKTAALQTSSSAHGIHGSPHSRFTSKRALFEETLHDVVAYLVMCEICMCELMPSMHVRITCVRPVTALHDTIRMKDRHDDLKDWDLTAYLCYEARGFSAEKRCMTNTSAICEYESGASRGAWRQI